MTWYLVQATNQEICALCTAASAVSDSDFIQKNLVSKSLSIKDTMSFAALMICPQVIPSGYATLHCVN